VLSSRLSGGTKRKVLLATVTASESRCHFSDEPTTGLDPISRRELWEILRALGKENGLFFLPLIILKRLSNLADTIGILKDGQLVSIGTLSELRKTARYQYASNCLLKCRFRL